MRATTTLAVKGTAYYKADSAFANGSLYEGASIQLVHEPNNPYDSNAVAVHLRETGDMLGHISRKLALKYLRLLDAGSIVEGFVHSISRTTERIHLKIRLVHTQIDCGAAKQNTRYWESFSSLPSEPGVYSIINIETGRQYIGSSINVRDRALAHFRDLTSGSHSNELLQTDFDELGADYFEVQLLTRNISFSEISTAEREHISKLLNDGSDLYNMTLDGQGIATSGQFRPSIPESVSDRYVHPLQALARTYDINSISFELSDFTNIRIGSQYLAGDKTVIMWHSYQPYCLHISGGESTLMYCFRSAEEKIIKDRIMNLARLKGFAM